MKQRLERKYPLNDTQVTSQELKVAKNTNKHKPKYKMAMVQILVRIFHGIIKMPHLRTLDNVIETKENKIAEKQPR